MSNFHVGQRVCCVNDKEGAFNIPGVVYERGDPLLVEVGEIYTIRELGTNDLGQPELRLVGIVRFGDAWLHQARFRPLIETDISIFQAILANPHKELETV